MVGVRAEVDETGEHVIYATGELDLPWLTGWPKSLALYLPLLARCSKSLASWFSLCELHVPSRVSVYLPLLTMSAKSLLPHDAFEVSANQLPR